MKTLLLLTLAALPAFAQSAPAPAPAPEIAAPAASAAAPANPADALPAFDPKAAYLFDGTKYIRMDESQFVIITRNVWATILVVIKMPGISADTRAKRDTHPFLLIGGSTKGGQMVRLSVDTAAKDPHRETRLVGEGQITGGDRVPFHEEKLPSGWHKVTPSLQKPGEYAWFPFFSTAGAFALDFGVD